MRVGSEQCDDGGVDSGDGCSDVCGVEDHWVCDSDSDRDLSVDICVK